MLQRLTEGNGFMLLEDGGRTIQPHPFFRIIATANTNGRGDDTGLYSGTRALGAAFINRFKPYIDVEYMPAEEERALLQSKVGMTEDDARIITNYSTEHRVSFMQANLTLPCSPRDTMALGMAYLTIRVCLHTNHVRSNGSLRSIIRSSMPLTVMMRKSFVGSSIV